MKRSVPRTGLAAVIRRHHLWGEYCSFRLVATGMEIVRDLRAVGWTVTRQDVYRAWKHSKRMGRPRKPPAEHEVLCPHCNKPIIVETGT